MDRYYIVLLDSFIDEMEALTDEEYGSLVRAGQRYAMTGEICEVVGNAKYYLRRMINVIDYYAAKLEDTNTRRKAKTKAKAKKEKENKIKGKDKEREEKSGVPPSLTEVEAYCQEAGLQIDPSKFYDYYTARGWMMDGQVMANWQAAARNWARRERGTPASSPEQTVSTVPNAGEVERMQRLREQLRHGNEGDSTK